LSDARGEYTRDYSLSRSAGKLRCISPYCQRLVARADRRPRHSFRMWVVAAMP